jgi:hypothetical protein
METNLPRAVLRLTTRAAVWGSVLVSWTLIAPGLAEAQGASEDWPFPEGLKAPADIVFSVLESDSKGLETAALDPRVREVLWHDYYQPYGLSELPEQIPGFAFDLDRDGSPELFLETPIGGSSGPHYLVFSTFDDSVRVVLGVQGWLYILATESGWHPIASVARFGPDDYRITRYVFSGEKYQAVENDAAAPRR